MALSLERRLVDKGAVVLKVVGSIDAKTFDQLEQELQQMLASGAHRIIIELSGVKYISSAGIGAFMNAMSEARRREGDLVLMNPSPEVTDVFDTLHLLNLFNIAGDINVALACFSDSHS